MYFGCYVGSSTCNTQITLYDVDKQGKSHKEETSLTGGEGDFVTHTTETFSRGAISRLIRPGSDFGM